MRDTQEFGLCGKIKSQHAKGYRAASCASQGGAGGRAGDTDSSMSGGLGIPTWPPQLRERECPPSGGPAALLVQVDSDLSPIFKTTQLSKKPLYCCCGTLQVFKRVVKASSLHALSIHNFYITNIVIKLF